MEDSVISVLAELESECMEAIRDCYAKSDAYKPRSRDAMFYRGCAMG